MSAEKLSGTAEANPPAPWPEDAVEVGRILGAWGVKGWVKVQPFSGDGQGLMSAKQWLVQPPQDSGPLRAGYPSSLKVADVREHGGLLVAQLHGVADRNQSEALRGARLFAQRAHFPKARPDEYYWVDLIGLDVVNREGQALGTVVGLIDTGPHSVLRLARPATETAPEGDEERLIPFVGAYVDQVDMAARRITVDWGLDY